MGPTLVMAARQKAAREAALCCHCQKLLTLKRMRPPSPPELPLLSQSWARPVLAAALRHGAACISAGIQAE